MKKIFFLFSIIFISFLTGCLTDSEQNLIESEGKNLSLFKINLDTNYTDSVIRSLFFLETDFSTGNIGRIDSGNSYKSVMSIYDDASIYSYKGAIYVLEQYNADNIVKLNSSATAIEYQIHLIDNANPHDIAFISDSKAYVACNSYDKILIINPSNGGIVDSIDVGPFAYKGTDQSNTIANAKDIVLKDGFAYISLQRRDGYNPAGATWVLKIDVSTDAIVDTFACTYPNGGKMILIDNTIYIPNIGGYQNITDGGIEKIDLLTGIVTTVASESQYGWNITQLTHVTNNLAVASCINYDADWNKTLLSAVFDLSTGTIIDTIEGVIEIGSSLYDSKKGRLYIAERSTKTTQGVCIWENGTYIKKIETDIAPNLFVFLED